MANVPPSLVGRLWLSCGAIFGLSLAAIIGMNLWNSADSPGPPQMINPAVHSGLVIISLCAIVIVIFGHIALRRGWRRFSSIMLLPFALLVLILSTCVGRAPSSEIDRVTLRDGRVFILAVSPMLTDVDYQIWQSEPSPGLTWSLLPQWVNYSEDGAFVGGEQLMLSPNGRYLVIRRGGILTDCFRTDAALTPCSRIIATWGSKDPVPWVEQSRSIAELTGVSPGTDQN